jgi:uncharacterized C2H2 Zn-finger protein
MPPYICYFCNKSFIQRNHIKNHFYKKVKCDFNKKCINNNTKTVISHDDMVLMFDSDEYHNLFLEVIFDENKEKTVSHGQKCTDFAPICTGFAPELHQNAPFCTGFAPELHQNAPFCTGFAPKCTDLHQNAPKCTEISTDLNESLKCNYCNMIFSRKSSKIRHINEKRCKIIKKNLQMSNYNYNITNSNNNIIIDNSETNVTQNIIQNNTQNNTHNNITINCYGKENLSYITTDIIEDIIKTPLTGIPKLIEMIHLNPDHPENNNIKLVNKNLPFLNYYNGDYWKTADKSTVLGNLLKSKTELTDKYFKKMKEDDIHNLYPKYSDAIKYVVTNFEFEDPLLKYKPSKKAMLEIYKKLEKDLYTMILNHREFVKDICDD